MNGLQKEDRNCGGISVVIPTYKRSDVLRDTLTDLSRQKFACFEVIVVLQMRPQRAELEAMPCRPRVFYVGEPNASLARNIGLLEARHDIVLFLDDDVRIDDPHFLHKHARNFNDDSISGVCGQVLEVGQVPTIVPDPATIETPSGWTYLPANYGRRCRTRDGRSSNLAVRREWAIAVGGMDAQFAKGARREETEFNLRYTAKYDTLVFDPDASLVHLSAHGGSRAWSQSRRIVPMHHIVGHWYFLLAALKQRQLPPRAIALELRHIVTALLVNPQRGREADILGALINLSRSISGAAWAMRKFLSGPRLVNTVNSDSYSLIFDGGSTDASTKEFAPPAINVAQRRD